MKIEQAHLMRYNCQQIYFNMFARFFFKVIFIVGVRRNVLMIWYYFSAFV